MPDDSAVRRPANLYCPKCGLRLTWHGSRLVCEPGGHELGERASDMMEARFAAAFVPGRAAEAPHPGQLLCPACCVGLTADHACPACGRNIRGVLLFLLTDQATGSAPGGAR